MVQHRDKAVEREVAYFLKCDWLAFLRYSGVGQRIWVVIIVSSAGLTRNSACKSQIKAMLRPFGWKVLENCVTANCTPRSYLNASVCSSTIDFHKTGGKKAKIGGHLSSFQHSVLRTSSPPPSTFSEQPTCAKTIQRRRHIGSLKKIIIKITNKLL